MLKFLGLTLLSIGAAHATTLYTSPCSQASYCSEVAQRQRP